MLKYCALSFLVCTSLHAGRPGEGSDSEGADSKAPLARTSSGSSSSGSDLDEHWPSSVSYKTITIADAMVDPKLIHELLLRGGAHPQSVPQGSYITAPGDGRDVHRNVFKVFSLMPDGFRTAENASKLLTLLKAGHNFYQSRTIAVSDKFVTLFELLPGEQRTLENVSVVQKFLTREGVNQDTVTSFVKLSPADRLEFMQGMNRLIGKALVDQTAAEETLDSLQKRSPGDLTGVSIETGATS